MDKNRRGQGIETRGKKDSASTPVVDNASSVAGDSYRRGTGGQERIGSWRDRRGGNWAGEERDRTEINLA